LQSLEEPRCGEVGGGEGAVWKWVIVVMGVIIFEQDNLQAFSGPLGEITIDCGHCTPFVSKIDEMIEVLFGVLRKIEIAP
jgi:hypothetical protein